MAKQVIISISREYGSGGHEIAEKIAKRLDLKIYDHRLLDHMAEEMHVDSSYMKEFDEKPSIPFATRRVKGLSSSMEEHIAELQFDYLQKKAAEGESFVLVGRCGESVLKNNENLISIFILGDEDKKISRIMEKYQLKRSEAVLKIKKHDLYRRKYHNNYSKYKWGDSRGYNLCINSSKLGIDGTVEALLRYISQRCGE